MLQRDGASHRDPFIMNFDGLCEPKNPGGVATFGIIIRRNGRKIFEDSGLAEAEPFTESASNNVAEYSALIRGLEWLKTNGHLKDAILVRGDSRLVINQLNGTFKVKAPRIIELHLRAKELLSEFTNARLEWVDRSLNSEADLLSRVAYSRYLKVHRPS